MNDILIYFSIYILIPFLYLQFFPLPIFLLFIGFVQYLHQLIIFSSVIFTFGQNILWRELVQFWDLLIFSPIFSQSNLDEEEQNTPFSKHFSKKIKNVNWIGYTHFKPSNVSFDLITSNVICLLLSGFLLISFLISFFNGLFLIQFGNSTFWVIIVWYTFIGSFSSSP